MIDEKELTDDELENVRGGVTMSYVISGKTYTAETHPSSLSFEDLKQKSIICGADTVKPSSVIFQTSDGSLIGNNNSDNK